MNFDTEDALLLDQNDTKSACVSKCRQKRTILGTTVACVFLLVLVVVLVVMNKNEHHSPSRDVLQEFVSKVSPERIREYLHYYTEQSHIAGSPRDYDTAVYTRDLMVEFGIPKVELDEYSVLLSYPVERIVQITAPVNKQFTCGLKEAVYPQDPTSGLPSVATFLGYSASGDFTGPLVYVNYGQLTDFQYINETAKIDLTNKVVIVRYGQIFRGNKVALAQRYGAKAVLIYSDPIDDGYLRGPTYPDGPWRPESGVQRGSIFAGEGDPLTPAVPAWKTTPRLTLDEAMNPDDTYFPLPTIPAMPLSWSDAQPLLAALTGQAVPSEWQGGLPFPYHMGPGDVEVRVMVQMNQTVTKIWNVIGQIPGSTEPDRVVLVGNHRDAWTFGGGDPSSGTATMMELAHGLGDLVKTGWQPQRSIWICSWDAEEYGLVGSVEFVEAKEKLLMTQAVAYLNTDVAVEGSYFFQVDGMPSLSALVKDVSRKVPAPERSPQGQTTPRGTLWEAWKFTAGTDTPVLDANMGGSDFVPFQHHVGVPVLNFAYTSQNGSYAGVYHSNFDSYFWELNFGDPSFGAYASIAQIMGGLAIELATMPVLPFSYEVYADTLVGATSQLQNMSTQLDFRSMFEALADMKEGARRLEQVRQNPPTDVLAMRRLNDQLMLAERAFLFLQGVPGREWYRHLAWVGSEYNSYGSPAFGNIVDAIAVGDLKAAQEQILLVSVVIRQFTEFIAV